MRWWKYVECCESCGRGLYICIEIYKEKKREGLTDIWLYKWKKKGNVGRKINLDVNENRKSLWNQVSREKGVEEEERKMEK